MTMPVSRDLGFLLREQAARHGAHPAVIGGGAAIGYTEMAARAARIASFFVARGLTRGDRIGLLMNNRPEWIETFFGAMMAGAVVVAFSTWSKREELAYLIDDSDVRLLVTLDQFSGQNFADDLRTMRPLDVVLLGDDRDPGWLPYPAMLDAPQAPAGIPAEPEGDAIIIYTSGSSSRPKSVPLSHGGIIENGFNIGERQGYTEIDRVLLAPPLFWSYGSANAMSAVLTHGATLVLQSRFEPGEALDLIEQHRCTALYTLPSITAALISHPSFRPERTSSLRTGLTIGAPQDVRTAAEVLGSREICNVYGQTETYGNCCVTWHHWPLERRAACQGPPLPGVTIRIVDETTGAMLPAGQPGLIEVKGHVMRGYVGASASQTGAALTKDGFFRTGDIGELTETGDIRFIGRTTEMIKKGGINISPAEVEDVLMRHPAVALAGVVGFPDTSQGELIAAFVVVKPGQTITETALKAHCRDLASRYKIPDFISVREALPVTATGKLMRRDLKTLAAGLTQ
ncbi:MAG: class I adenylate-forming enzyme family protein [Acetobacteraceae bacterium]|jgi:fatty-acyl-CoA synthase